MQLVKTDRPIKTPGPVYGRSPAQSVLEDMRKLRTMQAFLLTDDAQRLGLCVSFWETRKVRGLLWPFFMFHNMHCQFKADSYRDKLNDAFNRYQQKGI